MLYYSINNKVYELELGDYYEDLASPYLHGQFLDFENLNLEEKYQQIDKLFGFVARSFVIAFGGYPDEEPDYKYSEEIREICRRISSVDRLQKFLHQRGNIERSIILINEFVEQILALREKMLTEEKETKLGVG